MSFCAIIAASETPATLGWLWQGVLLIVLVCLSGLFSGSESVLFSLSQHQLDQYRRSSNPLRRAAAALMRAPKRTLMTILLGNTTVNVLLFAVTYVLSHSLEPQLGWWVTPVSAAFSILVVLVGGEVIPKVLAVSLADRLAPISAAVVSAAAVVLTPINVVLNLVFIEPLTRLLFGHKGGESHVHRITTDELKSLLELNAHRGWFTRTEDLYLREAIDLHDLKVGDIMTPRVEMQAFDIARPVEELRQMMRATRLTKIPVYEGSIDNILGWIYAKVLFFEPDRPLRELLTPVRFVPQVISCEQLLKHFRDTRSQIAIVVDEFGGVAGLVTLEDVIEEIVGDIYDPEDQPDEPELQRVSDTEYDVSGRLSLHYWAETFGIARLTNKVATVGGLVMHELGRTPSVGDVVRIANLELRVTRMRGWRVERLRLRLLDGEGGAEDAT
ncbi:MAG: HlyC/CorC family transporter [Planctomycetota bacterium]|nr:MAG: HlyC/CorC family transporter [Planctomycetota bacterium]